MAQGEFTKEEVTAGEETLTEIMKAFPRKKSLEFIGHFNELFLLLRAAKAAAPNEKKGGAD